MPEPGSAAYLPVDHSHSQRLSCGPVALDADQNLLIWLRRLINVHY